MKEWWSNLAIREKQFLLLGGCLCALFLIYYGILSPIQTKTTQLRERLQRNQALLAWMQQADAQLSISPGISQSNMQTVLTSSLIGTIQSQLQLSPINSQLKQLRQGENNSILLSFNQVDADELLGWLMHLSKTVGITIAQLTISKESTEGTVKANLVLK